MLRQPYFNMSSSNPIKNDRATRVRLHGIPGNVSNDDITEALASRGFNAGEEGHYYSCERVRKSDGTYDAVVCCNSRNHADELLKGFDCFRWPRANCLTRTSLVQVDSDAKNDDIVKRTVFVSSLVDTYNNDRLKAAMEDAFGPVVGCVVGRSKPGGELSGFCTFEGVDSATIAVCTSKAAKLKVWQAVVKIKVFGPNAVIERYTASMGLQLMSHYVSGLLPSDQPKNPSGGLLPSPPRRHTGRKHPPVISLADALPPRQHQGASIWLSAGQPQQAPYICLQSALGIPPSVNSTADSSPRQNRHDGYNGNNSFGRRSRRRSVEEIEASVTDCSQQ